MKDINDDHPILKRANLKFLRKKIVLLSCSSNEVNGIWIITPPFYKLPRVLNGTLVAAIKDVLEHSQWKIPFEDEYLPHIAMKEAIGVTHGKLHTSGTKSIIINQEDDKISFLPSKHVGRNRGYLHLNDKQVDITTAATDEQLLKALEVAISYCE